MRSEQSKNTPTKDPCDFEVILLSADRYVFITTSGPHPTVVSVDHPEVQEVNASVLQHYTFLYSLLSSTDPKQRESKGRASIYTTVWNAARLRGTRMCARVVVVWGLREAE